MSLKPALSTLRLGAVASACLAIAGAAGAFETAITPGSRTLFLQVGAGSMSGGTFNNGGSPVNNALVNTATVTVPAAQLGSGSALPMLTDSTVTQSPYDNFAFCDSPATTGEIYVGGYYRTPGTAAAASLTVTTPPALINERGNTLPFTQIAWSSTGNNDNSQAIGDGTFTGSTQTLRAVSRNTWFESCMRFRYLNSAIVPAGTFTGQARFTLTAP